MDTPLPNGFLDHFLRSHVKGVKEVLNWHTVLMLLWINVWDPLENTSKTSLARQW